MEKKIIAFIPIRAGSKSIPLKNFKPLAGKPLFGWTAEAAINCPEIDELVISTDYPDIKKTFPKLFKSTKVKIFDRAPETATDTASSESAIFDYIEKEKPDFDYLVFIQATCPFIKSSDLTDALKKLKKAKADSLLTLVRQRNFFWKILDGGIAKPINYSPLKRPMRQQMELQKGGFTFLYWENGAFYISKKEALLSSKCRISGKIVGFPFEVPIDIDDLQDWIMAEKLLLKSK